MSKRTVAGHAGLDPSRIREWFGVTAESRGNRELIVRRGELLEILNTIERGRARNTLLRRIGRWLAGRPMVSLNPVRLLHAKRQELDSSKGGE